jgi:protein arginine kinase
MKVSKKQRGCGMKLKSSRAFQKIRGTINSMELDSLVPKICGWLRGAGPENEIVISTRLRLARNISGFSFSNRLAAKDRTELIQRVEETIQKSPLLQKNTLFSLKGLPLLDRQFLLERHLVSIEFSNAKNERALSLADNEVISLMILEEDHLRLQVLESGFNLRDCWSLIDRVDSEVEKNLTYAFHETLGYLTACPTNVGTGMRASCMLHLPGLVLTKQADKVLQALTKLNLATRGLFGEGSQASGNFFQISNQMTLGQNEEEIIEILEGVIRQIVDHEKEARNLLKEKKEERLIDQIWRAVGILKTARVVTSTEAMTYFSLMRLGLDLKMIQGISVNDLNKLFISTQPAHLQKLAAKPLTPQERDIRRADVIRETLKGILL